MAVCECKTEYKYPSTETFLAQSEGLRSRLRFSQLARCLLYVVQTIDAPLLFSSDASEKEREREEEGKGGRMRKKKQKSAKRKGTPPPRAVARRI